MLNYRSQSEPKQRRWALYGSVTIHCVLVILLLRGRSPIFVAPSSIRAGANGTSLTQLYWEPGAAESAAAASSDAQQHKTAHSPLTLKKKDRHKVLTVPQIPAPGATDIHEIAAAAAAPAPAAGSRYGSLTEGPSAGAEVRPALPVTTAEPMVGAGDLQGVAEGNVVVEITIDESGNIVSKIVVQSLGPNIDNKVLAALENWRFRPATRDGVPIPSKQDVVYHFKPR